MVVGFRFRVQNLDPISIRDQQDFSLHRGSIFEKDLGISETEILNWSQNKIGDQMFRFQNAINSKTEVWIRSPFETNYIFGLQPQKVFVIFGFRFRDQVEKVVSIRDQ